MGRPAVNQRQRLSYLGIPGARPPAGASFGPLCDIAPQRLHEQHLRKLRQDRLSARPGSASLLHRKPNRAFQPLPGRVVADVDLEQGRESGKHEAAYPRLAGHIATDELRDLTASPRAGKLESLSEDAVQLLLIVHPALGRAILDDVRIAV